MRRLVALAAATLAVSFAPAAATAEPLVLQLGTAQASSPVLLPGGAVLWLQGRGDATEVWRLDDPAGTPRRVATLAPTGASAEDQQFLEQRLFADADGEALVVTRFAERCSDCKYSRYYTVIDDVVAGLPGSTLQPVPCASASSASLPEEVPVALAGRVVAARGTCPDGTSAARLQHVGEAAPFATLPPGELPYAGAGPWLVTASGRFSGPQTLRLRDAETLALAREIDAGHLIAVAVGADGTVVFERIGGDRRFGLVVVPPGGEPRMLPGAGRPVAVAGGLVQLAGQPALARLQPLDGGAPLDVDLPHAISPLAFDGTRLAYVARPCQAALLVVRDRGTPAPDLGRTCVAARPGGEARLERDALAVDVTCPPGDPQAGCVGSLRAVLLARRLGPGSTGRWLIGGSYDLPPGTAQTVRLPLYAGALRFVRRTPPVRVELASFVGGSSSEPAPRVPPLRVTLPVAGR